MIICSVVKYCHYETKDSTISHADFVTKQKGFVSKDNRNRFGVLHEEADQLVSAMKANAKLLPIIDESFLDFGFDK